MKLTVDKSGRITLPKHLRKEMQLVPGTELHVESEAEIITLRPIRPRATLAKEFGIWVHQSDPSNDSIPEQIDRVREERLRGFF
jgi:AbrB family looped-hinge helix DNA binding protein